jgi:hypothetical protein
MQWTHRPPDDGFTLGHRPKAVIAIRCLLIAKAAHPATLEYACTVYLKRGRWSFFIFLFIILIAEVARPAGLLYALAISVLQCIYPKYIAIRLLIRRRWLLMMNLIYVALYRLGGRVDVIAPLFRSSKTQYTSTASNVEGKQSTYSQTFPNHYKVLKTGWGSRCWEWTRDESPWTLRDMLDY